MKKRLVGLFIAIIMVFQITTPALAASENNATYKAQRRIMDDYLALCDEMGAYADEDEIIAALLDTHPSLSIQDSSSVYYDENGEVPSTRCTEAQILLEQDYLIYDNDYDALIYFGYWEWPFRNPHYNTPVNDIVAFYTSNSSKLSYIDLQYAIYGYDYSKKLVGAIDPENGIYTNSYMSKVLLTKGDDLGVAFYIDDSKIRSGRILAPVTRNSSGTVKMVTAYHHAWSETNITGLSANISIAQQSIGLSVTWSTTINNWTVPSLGAILP